MTRRKTPLKLKRKVLKALKYGASKPQIMKHTTDWVLYKVVSQKERDIAKALHETIIDNIFNS